MNTRVTRRLGLGPVFVYEWLTASRRWQAFAQRSLFVLLLLVALALNWLNPDAARKASSLSGLASLGQSFFLGVIGTQLALVMLAAPAATAGAICLDRARGTLTHMLVTDLSGSEIVLGKLGASLIPILGLVACTLPMMELLTLMGGVDPDAILGAFIVTFGVAVLGCCLAFFFSLWVGKTHEALLSTYTVWGLWLLGPIMIPPLNWAFGVSLPIPPQTAGPFSLAFAPYWRPGTVDWSDYLWFLVGTCSISSLLVTVAVWRIRSASTRDAVRGGPSRFSRSQAARLVRRFDLTRYLPAPSLDNNPVFSARPGARSDRLHLRPDRRGLAVPDRDAAWRPRRLWPDDGQSIHLGVLGDGRIPRESNTRVAGLGDSLAICLCLRSGCAFRRDAGGLRSPSGPGRRLFGPNRPPRPHREPQ